MFNEHGILFLNVSCLNAILRFKVYVRLNAKIKVTYAAVFWKGDFEEEEELLYKSIVIGYWKTNGYNYHFYFYIFNRTLSKG